MLTGHLGSRDLALEDIHDHGRLALGSPSLDRVVVAHSLLLMAALYPVQLYEGVTSH